MSTNETITEIEQDQEAEMEPEMEPEEEDYTTEDHCRWYQYGKLVVLVAVDEDYKQALKQHMDQEQFWPNAWWISDHGNAHLLSID